MKISLIKRIFVAFVIVFIVLYAARAIYSYNINQDSGMALTNSNFYFSNAAVPESSWAASRKNYASERVEYTTAGSASVIDQKYERVANIVSKTISYDSDLSRFQQAVEANKAVIQMENSRGLQGDRRVDLTIGVRPDNFDQMRDEILKIGRINSSTSTKVDKTYEYRQMLADKDTLEKRKAAYEELKNRGGTITELLQIEERIIDVETQIQQQQIGLGEYSDENALCTINFSLYEGAAVSVIFILWGALTWTAGVYASFVGVMILVGLAAFIFMHVWEYLKKTLEPRKNNSEQKTEETEQKA